MVLLLVFGALQLSCHAIDTKGTRIAWTSFALKFFHHHQTAGCFRRGNQNDRSWIDIWMKLAETGAASMAIFALVEHAAIDHIQTGRRPKHGTRRHRRERRH